MYDYLIVTHIPVFYKVNLYNALSKKLRIHVVFIASGTDEKRSSDFIDTNVIDFSYDILDSESLQNRPKLENIRKIKHILATKKAKKIIVSGWDLIEFWYLVFTNPKSNNYLALESTIFESRAGGVRAWVKKLFLYRLRGVFASGVLHNKLLDQLGFTGVIRITEGVGIINKTAFDVRSREYKRKYLFVGRLIEEKNLEYLIQTFNQLPDCQLTIIGSGPLQTTLEQAARENIHFQGRVENKSLPRFYLEHDFFILPSVKETWGLVLEEALYFGLPVIVSDRCGASELVHQGVNGFVFSVKDRLALKKIIESQSKEKYNQLIELMEENKASFELKDERQIAAYVNV